uniref:Post-GPI attachment to proteins factor 2-like n=1 Tax=Strongyloides papillosus TaxID=174720 RepID=A0A0N5BHS5_STREA
MERKVTKFPCPRWHVDDIFNDGKVINKNEPVEGYNVYPYVTSFKTFGILCTYLIMLSYLISWVSYTWNKEELKYVLHDRAHVKYGNMFFKCYIYENDESGVIPSLFNLRLLVPFPNYFMRISVLTLIITRFFISFGHHIGAKIRKDKIISELSEREGKIAKIDKLKGYGKFYGKIIPLIPVVFLFELLCFAMVLIIHPALDSKLIYKSFFISYLFFSICHMILIVRSNMYKLEYNKFDKRLLSCQMVATILYIVSSPVTAIYHLSFASDILCHPLVSLDAFLMELLMIISYFAFHLSLMYDVKDIDFVFMATKDDLYFEVTNGCEDKYFPEMYREYCEENQVRKELKAVEENNNRIKMIN